MSWWTEWGKDVTLAVLAVYGAGLSTLNWLHARVKEKRQLKVEAAYAYPFIGDKFFDDHVRVIATNVGQRKVTVTSLGFEVAGRRLVAMPGGLFPGMTNTDLPAALDDGGRAVTHYVKKEIGKVLIKQHSGEHELVPYCEDSTGMIHRGKAMRVKAEEMLQNS